MMRRTKCIGDNGPAPKNGPPPPPAPPKASFAATHDAAVGDDFYNGIEWLACWMLDNVEGEIITEEQLRPWAAKAWEAHLKRQDDRTLRPAE